MYKFATMESFDLPDMMAQLEKHQTEGWEPIQMYGVEVDAPTQLPHLTKRRTVKHFIMLRRAVEADA